MNKIKGIQSGDIPIANVSTTGRGFKTAPARNTTDLIVDYGQDFIALDGSTPKATAERKAQIVAKHLDTIARLSAETKKMRRDWAEDVDTVGDDLIYENVISMIDKWYGRHCDELEGISE